PPRAWSTLPVCGTAPLQSFSSPSNGVATRLMCSALVWAMRDLPQFATGVPRLSLGKSSPIQRRANDCSEVCEAGLCRSCWRVCSHFTGAARPAPLAMPLELNTPRRHAPVHEVEETAMSPGESFKTVSPDFPPERCFSDFSSMACQLLIEVEGNRRNVSI